MFYSSNGSIYVCVCEYICVCVCVLKLFLLKKSFKNQAVKLHIKSMQLPKYFVRDR